MPKCWLEGDESVETSVSLRCRSDGGTPPLQYVWRRESGGPIPPTITQGECDVITDLTAGRVWCDFYSFNGFTGIVPVNEL